MSTTIKAIRLGSMSMGLGLAFRITTIVPGIPDVCGCGAITSGGA
jgi:hypothetical protein